MIKPTIGRIVHFHPNKNKPPRAAIIADVISDTCVNLTISMANGNVYQNPPKKIRLVQPYEDLPEEGSYCCWMPYQVKKETGSESGEKEAGTEEI